MNKRTLFLICAVILAGCSEDPGNKDKKNDTCDPPCQTGETCVEGVCRPAIPGNVCDPPCGEGETCVGGICQPAVPVIECDPPCGETEICVDGLCESICRPECDPDRQKCDPASKTCLYIENYCEPGTCSPDKRRFCPPDGDNAGIWGECPAGESCFHGTCLPELPTECTEGTCNEVNQACVGGSWQQCSALEVCTDGRCVPPAAECTPGMCIEGDSTYICGPEHTPVKCEAGRTCVEGRCAAPLNREQKLLWTICDVNSDCSYGSCVKELTLSRETRDPDDPYALIGRVSMTELDPRIPAGKGLCTADCTKDAALCNPLSHGDRQYTCQLVFEGKSVYPPEDQDGNAIPLPFADRLDTEEMAKGVPFAAMCRPFVQGSGYPADFGKPCLTHTDCSGGTKCLDNACTVPCAESDDCPLTFSCAADAELGNFCRPDSGTFTECRDRDGDGYGAGLCTNAGEDCNDRDAGTFYTTNAPSVCSDGADTNCNGRIDAHELLGSEEHCEKCGKSCTAPSSKFHVSRLCLADNGGAEFDDYKPETYQFSCFESCAPGYADCNGDSGDGCETPIVKLSKTDDAIKVYGSDADKDGFGSDKDGTSIVDDKEVYDKNSDDRAFCCANGSQCYGYAKADSAAVTDRLWRVVDIAGYSENRTDCDDANPAVRPDADEICDGIDNNCSGTVDEPENLYDGQGNKVDTASVCDTGKDGICRNGKMCCEKIGDAYSIYCKADNAALVYEICNGLSDDCDAFVDEGAVEIDKDGNPVKQPDGSYRLLDPAQDPEGRAADYVCTVDKNEFPEARGKCMYGRYTCDPSRVESGKEAVYCKPFTPDPFDFMGDDYDANCDGFDGDLKHTLFVTGNTQLIGLQVADDYYTVDDFLRFSKKNETHRNPLATLKAAAALVSHPELIIDAEYKKNADGVAVLYEPDADECKKIEHITGPDGQMIENVIKTCEPIQANWEIALRAGTVPDQRPGVPLASKQDRIANLKIAKVRKDEKGIPYIKTEDMIPAVTKNAWFRIYGGAEYEEVTPDIRQWKLTGEKSNAVFDLTEDDFYQPSGMTALFDMTSDSLENTGSLYMHQIDVTAAPEFTVDAGRSDAVSPEDRGKSPATLIGFNAMRTSALTLDDVIITLSAPNGRDGDTAAAAEVTQHKEYYDKPALGGGVKIAKTYENDPYNLDYHYFKNGYIVDTTDFDKNAPIPVCSNNQPINPGHMGGYTRLDEFGYYPLPGENGKDSRNSDYVIQKRMFRNFLGIFKPQKYGQHYDDYTEDNPYRLFQRLWGIGYDGRKGSVTVELTSEGVKTETWDNIQYSVDRDVPNRGICRPSVGDFHGLCAKKYNRDAKTADRTDDRSGQNYRALDIVLLRNEERGTLVPRAIPPVKPKEIDENIIPKNNVVIYNNDYFDGNPETVESVLTAADTHAGTVDEAPLLLKKQNGYYHFIGQTPASRTDGQNGINGRGGAGAPIFIPEEEFFTRPMPISKQNNYFDIENEIERYLMQYISQTYENTIFKFDNSDPYIGYYLYPTADIHIDDKINLVHDPAYSFSTQNLMLGLYDAFTFHHINQNYRAQMTPNSIAYLMGASGGYGGCGGVGGRGGRPGSTAVGIVFSPNGEQAHIDIGNAELKISGGNGGKGAAGSSGSSGKPGGSAYIFGNMQLPGPACKTCYNEQYFAANFKTTPGYPGIGGSGGSGGAGAQGGYAMGIIIDCNAVQADNYTQCREKLKIRMPKYEKIATLEGIDGFEQGSSASNGQGTTTSSGGTGGKPTPKGTRLPEAKIINGQSVESKIVRANQKISCIFKIDGNRAQLGTTSLLK